MGTAKINSKRLRLCLKELISDVYDNAYYSQAAADAKFPYVTYEYTLKKSGDKRLGTLEINVWDMSGGTEAAEEIADSFENGLDGLIYTDRHMVLKLYINTRTPVTDDNKKLKRRMLLFEMQYYAGGEE